MSTKDTIETPATAKQNSKQVATSCKICAVPDTDEMVQCDVCNEWYHYTCVGVTSQIEMIPWKCSSCQVPQDSKQPQSQPSKQTSTISHRSNQLDLKLQMLEEEMALAEKREMEAQNRQQQRDKEYLDRRFKLLQSEGSESAHDDKSAVSTHVQRVSEWVQSISEKGGAIHTDTRAVNLPKRMAQPSNIQQKPRTHCSSHLQFRPTNFAQAFNDYSLPSPITSQQLAARHALPKELPTFTGRPEDWPLFIASFQGSTKACGFTDVENLIRLQKCLKGKALDAVKSKLLLPYNVTSIMQTLEMLYGRPEYIINSLLQTVRQEPNPKPEKLETLIPFALAVDNMCSVMEACQLFDHLSNPLLLQELTEKLPANIKLNWASFRCNCPDANLSTFGNWLMELASTISTVTFTGSTTSSKGQLHVHKESATPPKKVCIVCTQNCNKIENCKKFAELSLDDKWGIIKQHSLCRTCLCAHVGAQCKLDKKCGVNDCVFRHHRLLHNAKKDEVAVAVAQCGIHNGSQTPVLFRILPININGRNGQVKAYAFLDEGSSLTLMDESLADELGLQGVPNPLYLKWTGETHRTEENSKMVSIQISALGKSKSTYHIQNVRTVKALDLPVQSVSMERISSDYPYLKGIPIDSYEDAVPRVLIGLDNWRLALPLKCKEGGQNEPIATKTRLGWAIYGEYTNATRRVSPNYVHSFQSYHHCDCVREEESQLRTMMKEYISLDSLGVTAKTLQSKDDQRASDILDANTIRVGNRFETSLLWKYDNVQLPDSYPMALRRFKCLQKKLERDAELKQKLQSQIKAYLQKGYIRKLSPMELKQCHPRTWYLPVFPVHNPNKPDKIRLVWDAAAKVNSTSLNSVLLKGPDLLTSMLGVLFRFRERRIAICGDISEMYHQVRVKPDDQHAQRFLWCLDESQNDPEIFVMQVMTFGATCSPASAQYVMKKNAMQFSQNYPRAVSCITDSHYVDDLLDSVNTEAEAVKLARDVKMIHQHGGFEIGKWISNSSRVIHELGADTNEKRQNLNMSPDTDSEKVLGMWWCTSSDCFTFVVSRNKSNAEILGAERRPTKREVLRIMMTIFDPLGLIANFLINIKILMQDIWRTPLGAVPIDWDDPITDEQFGRWREWILQLRQIEKLRIPRCYFDAKFGPNAQADLHVFVDASDKAYAAVAFLRIKEGEKVECRLVAAKTRVAPLKLTSIPRLELEAARLGSRLASSIVDNHSLKFGRKIYWSDSNTVLCWIRSDSRSYRQYVAFRVAEILETTESSDWRYVPTKLNVADEATKWQKSPSFESSSRWFNGPPFLLSPESEWPADTSANATTNEERSNHVFIIRNVHDEYVIDMNRFKNWKRLLRSQVFVFRYIFNSKAKVAGTRKRMGYIVKEEYLQAEIHLYRQAQSNAFAAEIAVLTRNTDLPEHERQPISRNSSVYQLCPYLDEDGVLRARGRIDAAPGVAFDVKRPIILPKGHQLTRLVIRDFHERFHHQNHETVVNELRQRFLISNLRAAVKDAVRNCQLCNNNNAVPRAPRMGDLPNARLATFHRPFSYSGIDYFGPIMVQFGRRVEKRWGVLITCLTTRAIHIEVANTLSSDSCILAIKRFVARRGTPIEFHSDNGTNFHGSDRELQEATKLQTDLAEEFSSSATKWIFNPPAAPHMGGCWERMVRQVKKVLKQIAPKRNPSDELLHSMLLEVERVVNSHPLTYVPLDAENDEALTPNHLLLGSSDGSKPDGIRTDEGAILRQNWKRSQQYANMFWKRWLKEYLPTLTRRAKWFQPVKPIKVGDIVIVVDDAHPRNLWPKGRILETMKSKDGQVRKVTVQTDTGIYVRPAVKIAVLDVRSNKPSTSGASYQEGVLATPPEIQNNAISWPKSNC